MTDLRSPSSSTLRPGGSERGVALIIALLAMLLMTALGMALMLVSETESMIGSNYRDSVEASYVADAGIERVMQDVLSIPDWNVILTSPDNVRAGVTSGFVDGTVTPTLVDGRTINLISATNMINCNKTTSCSDADMDANDGERQWTLNNPRFRLFAWGPVNDLNPTATINSPFYVAVWIADDGPDDAVHAKSLAYMGLHGGERLAGKPVQVVFVGSCTNARLSDLELAARVLEGRKVASGVRMLVVPGSQQIKREAESLGLAKIFIDAGAEWRESGCSMCIGMNGDTVDAGQYAVSTSNRNFEGRQGKGARTLLASPATAAAAAVTGRVSDPREFLAGARASVQ